MQERRPLGRQLAAHLGPGDLGGWPGFTKREARSRQVTTAAGRTAAPRPTYSPSAMHSISSTCPLSTVLELESPDGMKNDGLLSLAGSSEVTHTHNSEADAHIREAHCVLQQSQRQKPLRSGTRPLHYRPQSPCFMVRSKFYVVVYRASFRSCQLNGPAGGCDKK